MNSPSFRLQPKAEIRVNNKTVKDINSVNSDNAQGAVSSIINELLKWDENVFHVILKANSIAKHSALNSIYLFLSTSISLYPHKFYLRKLS